jgi:hypothetical protein
MEEVSNIIRSGEGHDPWKRSQNIIRSGQGHDPTDVDLTIY